MLAATQQAGGNADRMSTLLDPKNDYVLIVTTLERRYDQPSAPVRSRRNWLYLAFGLALYLVLTAIALALIQAWLF